MNTSRAAVALVVAALTATPLCAQLVIGTTGGAVHYDQQATTSTVAVNPELRYERHGLVFDGNGGYTSGSDGSRAVDGSGTLWAATNAFAGHWQLDALIQGSTYLPHADSSSATIFGLGEVALASANHGIAAGVGTVQASIQGTPAVGALRTEVRGWFPLGDVAVTASVEPTRLAGSWFAEYAAGAEWSPGKLDVSGGLRLRQVSGAASNLGGTGSVTWDFSDRFAAELDGGRYLRDPYQGLPAAYFMTLSFRVTLAKWKSGTGSAVGAASLGDVSMKAAASSLGFASHGLGSQRSGSRLPAGSGGSSGRGTGNGHKP